MLEDRTTCRWSWCVGLVGKPSAGKSTFFNAVAQSELAKTSPQPFTTIDPNVAHASVPHCPATHPIWISSKVVDSQACSIG